MQMSAAGRPYRNTLAIAEDVVTVSATCYLAAGAVVDLSCYTTDATGGGTHYITLDAYRVTT